MNMLVVIFLAVFCAFTNGGQWSGASGTSSTKNLWQSNSASNSWSVPNHAPVAKYQGPIALPPGYDETGAPLPVKDTPEVDHAKALQLAAIAKAGGDIYPATGPDPWEKYASQSHSSSYGQQAGHGSKKWKRSVEESHHYESHHESPEQEALAKLAHDAAVNKAKAEIAAAVHQQKKQIQNSWSISTYAPKYTGPQALPGGYDKNGAPLPVQDTYEVAEVKSKQLSALVKAGGDIYPAKHYPEIYRSTVDAWKSQNNDWPSSSNAWPSQSSSNAWPSQSSSNAWPSQSSSNAWPSQSSSNAWPSSSSSNAWPSQSSSNAWPSQSSNAWPSQSSSNAWPSSSSSNAWPSQSSSNAWPSQSSSNAWPSQSSSNAWPSSSSTSLNAWPSQSSSNAWPSSANAWPSASNNAWKIPSYAADAIRYHGPIALPPGYDINGAPLPVEDTPEVAALKYKHLQTQAKIAAERKQQWQPKW